MHTTETNLAQVSALTLITPIKQGFLPDNPAVRYVDRLRAFLETIQGLVNKRQPTALDGINTVHFARWVIIDDDQRLLFTSNFDGTLNSYLRDFANNETVATALNKIWGNCDGYPGADPARFQLFEDWVHKYAVPTTCFYAVTPDITVRDIKWLLYFKGYYDEMVKNLQDNPEQLPRLFADFQGDVLRIGDSIAAQAQQIMQSRRSAPLTSDQSRQSGPPASSQLAANIQRLATQSDPEHVAAASSQGTQAPVQVIAPELAQLLPPPHAS